MGDLCDGWHGSQFGNAQICSMPIPSRVGNGRTNHKLYCHTSPLQLPFFSPLHVITLHFKISIQDLPNQLFTTRDWDTKGNSLNPLTPKPRTNNTKKKGLQTESHMMVIHREYLGVFTTWYFKILALLWSAAILSGKSLANSPMVASMISLSLWAIHLTTGANTSSSIEGSGS